MANSVLSLIIPVKELGAAEMTILYKTAGSAPSVDVVAVGRVSADAALHVSNLTVLNRDCSIYEAMNVGALAARSDYLLFMGIDDLLIASNVGPVIEGLRSIESASLVVLPFKVRTRLVRQAPVEGRLSSFHHQGVLFHRQTLLDLGGYGAKYRLHSDLDLMFRMQRGRALQALPWPLVVFSKGGMTTSGRHAMRSIREFSAIYREQGVSRLAFSFVFSVALLACYRLRFVLRSAISPEHRRALDG